MEASDSGRTSSKRKREQLSGLPLKQGKKSEDGSSRKRKMEADQDSPNKFAKTEDDDGLGDDITIRSYQKKAFDVAMERNTIVVLGTGSGKTMIAVMLLKEIAEQIKREKRKRLMIFLAPTVHLVIQQCQVIRSRTNLLVEDYYGAKGIDDWKGSHWLKEIDEHEVMVMTPQILLDALRNAFLTLEIVKLLIFDECHYATGNHPYTKIMLDFYHQSLYKPMIFGMTASPVRSKGISSIMDCEDQFEELEGVLDCQIYASEDRTELQRYVPVAKELNRYYDSGTSTPAGLKEKLLSLLTKFQIVATHAEDSHQPQFADATSRRLALKNRLSRFHDKILYCLENHGLYCAYEAVKVCLRKEATVNSSEGAISSRSGDTLRDFLQEVLGMFEASVPTETWHVLVSDDVWLDDIYLDHTSPKVSEFVSLVRELGESEKILCMTFVERIVSAKVLCALVRRLKCLSNLTCAYLTGKSNSADGLTPKEQRATLDSFRKEKVNLLLTTDVAEEGIDIINCSCVIRFDLPKSARSYIQSRGRARQSDSRYILLLERGNHEQRNSLSQILKCEEYVNHATINRDSNISSFKWTPKDERPVYKVLSTGATVTADSSISLLINYCQRLPGDTYFSPRPSFRYVSGDGYFQCTLKMPSNAAFQELVSASAVRKNFAKQLVCLEACKRLHMIGALDDQLRPTIEEPQSYPLAKRTEESGADLGTTKRKELHGSTTIDALSGTWANISEPITLNAYSLEFSCDASGEEYPGFVLLVDAKLDVDVSNAGIDLYLHDNRVVKTKISACNNIHLDANQVYKSKKFQELLFNAVFGKLSFASRDTGENIRLLEMNNVELWSRTKMYLLLPLEQSSFPGCGNPLIDWAVIDRCFSVVEFLNKNSMPIVKCSPSREVYVRKGSEDLGSIHLANVSCSLKDLREKIVLAVHTGRTYYVAGLMDDMTADSPFDGSADGKPSIYGSYADYFVKKYGILLHYSHQSLLLLKQAHNPHNLLVSNHGCEEGHNGIKRASAVSATAPLSHVYMPPELCITLNVPRSILRSLYLLPSVLHRIESLLLASQLKKIVSTGGCPRIPSSLILEALTTQRCAEDFSLERLELLGDSVLKYAISCNLFLNYPLKHEGQLSARRSSAVCNATLYCKAVNHDLQKYVRDAPFDPLRWVAPGQRSLHPCPCKCKGDASKVPMKHSSETEENSIKIGITCDKGHRWICSKTLSDSLEALIGAYYVSGGLDASVAFMKWAGMDAGCDSTLIEEVPVNALSSLISSKANDLQALESILGYTFRNKGFLLEAITHASQQDVGEGVCYQRLEFLGDSVLDLLITRHLFHTYKSIDPGQLTDLRSAAVNNETFAQAAVRHGIYEHLLHGSEILQEQIGEYVEFVKKFPTKRFIPAYGSLKGPKVLGDIIESIAGAILIDTGLNLEEVWRVFEPILSPFATPEDLHLNPTRELNELCSQIGASLRTECTKVGELTNAKIMIQLQDCQLTGEGRDNTKKHAKEQAAYLLLAQMEGKGISHKKCIWRGKVEPTLKVSSTEQPSMISSYVGDLKAITKGPSNPTPATVSVSTKKGGPRTSLHQFCGASHWVMPVYETEGVGLRFVTKITLHIPDSESIQLEGEEGTDKRSSMDSAALILLTRLAEMGKCILDFV